MTQGFIVVRLLVCVGVTDCLGCPPTYVVDSTTVQ